MPRHGWVSHVKARALSSSILFITHYSQLLTPTSSCCNLLVVYSIVQLDLKCSSETPSFKTSACYLFFCWFSTFQLHKVRLIEHCNSMILIKLVESFFKFPDGSSLLEQSCCWRKTKSAAGAIFVVISFYVSLSAATKLPRYLNWVNSSRPFYILVFSFIILRLGYVQSCRLGCSFYPVVLLSAVFVRV